MNLLTREDQKILITRINDLIKDLPKNVTNADVLTFFDMAEKSESLKIPQPTLLKSIADGEEPFLMIFHAGSALDDSQYFAFQIELWKTSWIIRAGKLRTDGQDFLVPFNKVTVSYDAYDLFSTEVLLESIFDTFRRLLSGQIVLLTSKNTSREIYASELMTVDASTQHAIDTNWFGKKNAVPLETTVLKNSLLPINDPAKNDFILAKQTDGKPLLNGRSFDHAEFLPLTYAQYRLYASPEIDGSRKILQVLAVAFPMLYIGLVTLRNIFPSQGNYFLIAELLGIVLLLTFTAWKFPRIVAVGVIPVFSGIAAIGAFAGAGWLLMHIAWIESAVNGENIPLSMTLVLGWFALGIAAGIVVFVKVEKQLKKFFQNKLT